MPVARYFTVTKVMTVQVRANSLQDALVVGDCKIKGEPISERLEGASAVGAVVEHSLSAEETSR